MSVSVAVYLLVNVVALAQVRAARDRRESVRPEPKRCSPSAAAAAALSTLSRGMVMRRRPAPLNSEWMPSSGRAGSRPSGTTTTPGETAGTMPSPTSRAPLGTPTGTSSHLPGMTFGVRPSSTCSPMPRASATSTSPISRPASLPPIPPSWGGGQIPRSTISSRKASRSRSFRTTSTVMSCFLRAGCQGPRGTRMCARGRSMTSSGTPSP